MQVSSEALWGGPLTGPAAEEVIQGRIRNSLDALLSLNKGPSRPPYALTGLAWIDDSNSALWLLKLFDGTDDIVMASIDPATNLIYWGKGQLAFPAVPVASSDPYTFDGYQELLFTPSLSATGTEPTPSYGNRLGYAVKMAGVLFWWINISWTALGTAPTGFARITGAPRDPVYSGMRSNPIRTNGFSTAYPNKTILGAYSTGPQILLETMDGADVTAANLPASGSLIGGGFTRIT